VSDDHVAARIATPPFKPTGWGVVPTVRIEHLFASLLGRCYGAVSDFPSVSPTTVIGGL
jgi:hypothetical protein